MINNINIMEGKEGKTLLCNKCAVEKTADSFRINRRVCKDCEREHGRQYRKNNPEKAQKWAEENKERMSYLQHRSFVANKVKINATYRTRYNNDDDFKKVRKYRRAVYGWLKGETRSACEYIGCTRDTFIDWIEHCFAPGMTMNNYGTYWTVDHVIPLSTPDEDFKLLANWRNISPVLVEFNLVKNKRIVISQVENQVEKMKQLITLDENMDIEIRGLFAKHLAAGSP